MIHSIRKQFIPLISILLWVMMCSLLPGISYAEEIEICYYNPDAAIKSIEEAVSAVKPFLNYINREAKLPNNDYFSWHHFAKAADMEAYLKQHKVEFVIANAFYFLNNKERLHLKTMLVPLRNGEIYYRKVLVVPKASPYQRIDDLKGKRLVMTAGGTENFPFLNALVFSNKYDIAKDFNITIVDKSSEALFALLLGNADAALVTKAAFEFVSELSPKAAQKLHIIHTSKKINLTPLTYVQGNVEQSIVNKLKEVCIGMSKRPDGAQTLLVFKVSAWREGNEKDFKEMLSYLKELKKGRSADTEQ